MAPDPSITTNGWNPPENLVVLRRRGKTFYSPSLFHLAPTHNRIVPLAIRDVVKARNLLEIYGVSAVEEHNKGYIMVNNYPVTTVQIFGRILWYSYKNFDYGQQKSSYNFLLIKLDDCSGENSSICVKLSESLLRTPLADITENLLVEVTGTVSHTFDYEKQVQGTSLRVLGGHTNIDLEMQCWRRLLSARKLLAQQWKCLPDQPIVIDSDDVMEIQKGDYKRQLNSNSPDLPSLPLRDRISRETVDVLSSPSLAYCTASENLHNSTESSPDVTRIELQPDRDFSLPQILRRMNNTVPSSQSPKIRKRIIVPLILRDSQNRPFNPTMHILDSDDDGYISDPIVSDSSYPTRNLLVIIID